MTSAIDSLSGTRTTPRMPTVEESGTRLLRNGTIGSDVKAVQDALRARGHVIASDGKFGNETERSIRAFQRSQGITVDGIVGPETRAKLFSTAPTTVDRREGDARAPVVGDRNTSGIRAGDLARADETRRRTNAGAVTLAPANATPEEKFRHYSEIVRRNGGTVNENGRATVLGLRGLSRDGNVHDTTSSRSYNDTFVVLKDGRAYEFSGATHAAQLRSTLSPDVNGDGRGDVGMIRPGNYTATPNGNYNGAASWHVKSNGSGNVPGYRDTNGDGVFSDAERRASERNGHTQSAILFHQGYADRPKSIGCQTMSPQQHAEFMRMLGGRGASFNYTLVDAYRQ